MFEPIPLRATPVRATQLRLERLYRAAFLGLKGDSLALSAGITPQEYRALAQMDSQVELAILKGRADGEMTHAQKLSEASMNGDAKASLAILQHVHGWTAKQEIEITAHGPGIKELLAEREARMNAMIEGDYTTLDTGMVTRLPPQSEVVHAG